MTKFSNLSDLFGAWLQIRGRFDSGAECARIEQSIISTPAQSLVGVLVKMRMAAIIDTSAHTLWHSALADLERLAGGVLPPAPQDDGQG